MTKEQVMDILQTGAYSLVICNNGLHTFNGHGISDLYHIYMHRTELLNGAIVADKIIGKGAATLLALGNVCEIITDVISTPALSMLKDRGISVSCRTVVQNIVNRQKDGICPVEQLCMKCITPEECMPLIEHFMSDKN